MKKIIRLLLLSANALGCLAAAHAAVIVNTDFTTAQGFTNGNLSGQQGWQGQTFAQVTASGGGTVRSVGGPFDRNGFATGARGGTGGVPNPSGNFSPGDSLRLTFDYQFTLPGYVGIGVAKFGVRGGLPADPTPTNGIKIEFNMYQSQTGGSIKWFPNLDDTSNSHALILNGLNFGLDPDNFLGQGAKFQSDPMRVSYRLLHLGGGVWQTAALSVSNQTTGLSWSYTGPARYFTNTSSDLFYCQLLANNSNTNFQGVADGASFEYVPPQSTLERTAGNFPSGAPGATLESAFVVTVRDYLGNAAAGTNVTFAIASAPPGATGMQLTVTNAVSLSNGWASTTLKLGNVAGTYTVTATATGLDGSPITFTAYANNTGPWPQADPFNTNNWIVYSPMTDEFNGSSLDANKWWPTTISWNGRQPVYHNPLNNAVSGGELILTLNTNTTGAPGGYTYSCGYIQSKTVRRYLYIEIKAKALDNSIVTGFWMNGQNSSWHREIDMLECPSGVVGKETDYQSNFHIWRTPTPSGVDTNTISDSQTYKLPFRMIDDYHVYGFEWDRNRMRLYADGVLIREKSTASFTLAQWLLIGNEFNTWFSPTVDTNRLPATFNLKYVRAWILPENPTTYYVDGTSGNDTNSGLSWAAAKKTIRAGVDASYDGDSLYVTAGNYLEYVTVAGTKNYSLYGGFLNGETLAQRNPKLRQSVIQSPPDGYGPMYVRGGENIRIDGFTLTGTTNQWATGLRLEGPLTNVVVANCRLVNNKPVDGAAAGASIGHADGVASVTFEDCEFSGNTTLGLYPGGAAATVNNSGRATFRRCLFANNIADDGAAALQSYWGPAANFIRVENCIFRNNTTIANRGVMDMNCGTFQIINCTFSTNSGDAIRIPNENTSYQQSVVIRNTIVDGNTGDGLELGWSGASAITTMSNSLFYGNATQVTYAGSAKNTAAAINALSWAKGNVVANPLFRAKTNADFRLATGSPAINAGTANLAATNDFDGIARPLGGLFDIGAYESTGTELLQRPLGLTARVIPGRIDAEDYDLGGESVAYHDTTAGNSGWQFRLDDVDIVAASENNLAVSGVATEWLEFTTTMTSGVYDLTARVANADAATTLRLKIDGLNLLTLNVPNTGGGYTNIVIPVVGFAGGSSRLLRAEFDGAASLDSLHFVVPVSPAPPALIATSDGGNLNLQWSGFGFKLQSQTNTLSSGLGTNWFDYPAGGTSPVVAPVNLANGAVFFRLAPL